MLLDWRQYWLIEAKLLVNVLVIGLLRVWMVKRLRVRAHRLSSILLLLALVLHHRYSLLLVVSVVGLLIEQAAMNAWRGSHAAGYTLLLLLCRLRYRWSKRLWSRRMLLYGNVLHWVANVHHLRSKLLRLVLENRMHLHIGFHDGCRVERGVA